MGARKREDLRAEGRAWAATARKRSSGCGVCSWLRRNGKARDYLEGVVEAMREGARPPRTQLFDALVSRWAFPFSDSKMRDHLDRAAAGEACR